jgi:hypothetical protein
MPVNIFISVDFPAPFSPINACTSPALSEKSTPLNAFTPGNSLDIPMTCNNSSKKSPSFDSFCAWGSALIATHRAVLSVRLVESFGGGVLKPAARLQRDGGDRRDLIARISSMILKYSSTPASDFDT